MMAKKYDKWLFLAVVIISLFGIVMIYSASFVWANYKFNDSFKYLKAQSLFFIVGLILMVILKNVDYHLYKKYANKILLVCFILLVLVLIPFIGKLRNGSRSWFGIGSFGIQPSEFAKIGLIIFVSKYLDKNDSHIKNIWSGVM